MFIPLLEAHGAYLKLIWFDTTLYCCELAFELVDARKKLDAEVQYLPGE